MTNKITKRLICLWKDCDNVFEDADALQEHVINHVQEQMQTDLNKQREDGTEEQQEEDEPLAKKAKLNEKKMTNGVDMDIGKRKIIFMAIEVWTDVLGFVTRIQLARTVSLTNRHIHQLCWPRLHGNKVVAHGVLDIFTGSRDELGHTVALLLKDGKEVQIPTSPMPTYIFGFSRIIINFLDEQLLAFFKLITHCMAANAISINFRMGMTNIGENQRAYVNKLLQILSEKKSPSAFSNLSCHLADIQYLQHVDNQTSRLCLIGHEDSDIPQLMKMLASPRPDGQQRVIYLDISGDLKKEMLKAIKKEFRASTQPLPQPFYLNFYGHNLDIPNSEELNPQTGEILMILPSGQNGQNRKVGIYRHPTGQHAQWAADARERDEGNNGIKTFIYMFH